jgi:hypothetical protein
MTERDHALDGEFETRGPGHKRTGHPRLSSHTPIRFEPETITAIREFSDEDGLTVSAWVRRLVNREIRRRRSLRTRTASERIATFSGQQAGPSVTTTASTPAYFLAELRPAV